MAFIFAKFCLLVLTFKPPDIFVKCEEVFGQLVPLKSPINTVSDKFLSFTIDPEYLFSNNGDLTSVESMAMANSLSPAYIRIAGPSTPYIKFENSSMELEPRLTNRTPKDSDKERKLVIDMEQWIGFAHWANTSDFTPVFALNSEQRTTGSGLWDPNEAIQIMSEAENEHIGECVWQLGNKCTSNIYQYLNDLQTLKIIIDTFGSGKSGKWKVTGSEIANCLDLYPEENLKEYLMQTATITDIAFLSGNTTSNQLDLLDFDDDRLIRSKLVKTKTDLWMSETPSVGKDGDEESEAMSWLNSLGNAARHGFSVYFKELHAKEFGGPTLSYYMSLLHKNLVGRNVLKLKLDKTEDGSRDAITLFAHCATLNKVPIPGAITLFGANRKTEQAKISVKLPGVEGGEVMQYILNLDRNGNIMVNSMPMFHDGEIRPTMKKLWLGKKTMLTLPPKSFGFWVLVNAKIPVCDTVQTSDMTESLEDEEIVENILLKDVLARNRKKRATTFIEDKHAHQSEPSEEYAEYEEIEDRETANKIVKMTDSNQGRKNMAQILAKLATFRQIAQSNDLNRMMKGIKQLFDIQLDKLRLTPRLENAVKELRQRNALGDQNTGKRDKRQVKGFEIKALKAKLKPNLAEKSVEPTKMNLLNKSVEKTLKTDVKSVVEVNTPKIEEKSKTKLFGRLKQNFSDNSLKSTKANLLSKSVDKTVKADSEPVVEEVKPKIEEKPKGKLLGKSKPKLVAATPKVLEEEKSVASPEPIIGNVLRARGFLGLRKKFIDRKAHLGALKGKLKLRQLGRVRRTLPESTESHISHKREKRSILNTLTRHNPTLANSLTNSELKEKTNDGIKISLPSLTGKINSIKKDIEKKDQEEISFDETKDNQIIKITRSPENDEENDDSFDGISMTAKISNGGAILNMEEPFNQSLTFLNSIVDNINYMASKMQKDLSKLFTLMAL